MKKTEAAMHADFLRLSFFRLAARGPEREGDINDPILRRVWRLGKRIDQSARDRKNPPRVWRCPKNIHRETGC